MGYSISKNEKLTDEQINFLKFAATIAEPYSFDDPILNMYDGECDDKRLAATRARQILLEHGIKI